MQLADTAFVFASLGIAAVMMGWASTGLVLRLFSSARHRSQPNKRTMHDVPTSNVGGIALVATLLGLGVLIIPSTPESVALAASVAGLAIVSLTDHYRPLGPLIRLVVQSLAVTAMLTLVPNDVRLAPSIPLEVERVAVGIAWLWMINLTNFIDGIDGMAASTGIVIAVGYLVVTMWPPTAAGDIRIPQLVALLMAGACLGYLVWNWHPARIFMGDSGSIPLGFLMGWLILDLVRLGFWMSAAIIPAIVVADATLTLLKRLLRGEKVWRAHKSHFYQRAVQGGTSPATVVRRKLIADTALVGLALVAKTDPVPAAFGAVGVVILLLAHWSTLASSTTRSEVT